MRTCLSTEIFPAKRIFPKNNLGSNKPILTLPGKIRYDIITNYRVIRSIISTIYFANIVTTSSYGSVCKEFQKKKRKKLKEEMEKKKMKKEEKRKCAKKRVTLE